jgi:peptide/nickel transport system permease protein
MRGIWPFIVRRILLGLLVLALVSVVVFAATQALPGDPAGAILGRSATPTSLKALRDQLGLDQPVLSQYWDWVTGLVHGDFGTSLAAQIPVSDLLGERLVNSAFLVFTAGLISIPLSVAIGAYAALRRDGTFDVASSIITLLFAALPEFVVGVALVVLFATTVFEWLPAVSLIPPQDRPWQHPKELILPTLTLVIAVTPYVARIMRASMIEVLESEYVEMARLKGVPERLVIRRHALPNALGPTFQVIALNLAYLAGGVIVVEFVFN